jgi:hypothetical protein
LLPESLVEAFFSDTTIKPASFFWADVTAVNPTRITRYDQALPFTVGSIAAVAVDDRVFCVLFDSQITILGKSV